MKTRHTLTLLLLVALTLMAACAGLETRTASTVAHSNNVRSLEQRPDFDAARTAAPEWVRDAEYRITELETELKEAKAK